MDILNAIKDIENKVPEPRKTQNTRNRKYTYPVKIKILQNDPCYIIKEIVKKEPPTISKSGVINENVYVYKQLPVQRGQRESRAIGQKLSRDNNERLRPTINVYFS